MGCAAVSTAVTASDRLLLAMSHQQNDFLLVEDQLLDIRGSSVTCLKAPRRCGAEKAFHDRHLFQCFVCFVLGAGTGTQGLLHAEPQPQPVLLVFASCLFFHFNCDKIHMI